MSGTSMSPGPQCRRDLNVVAPIIPVLCSDFFQGPDFLRRLCGDSCHPVAGGEQPLRSVQHCPLSRPCCPCSSLTPQNNAHRPGKHTKYSHGSKAELKKTQLHLKTECF